MIGILSDSHDNLTRVREAPLKFTHAGLRFLVSHLNGPVERHLASRAYDVIVFGHTHRPLAERRDGVLLANPGEAGGRLRGGSTVALLDPVTLSADIVTL